MQSVSIPRAHARRLAVHNQLLESSLPLRAGKEGVAQTIERLGYIQIDTISVIERAHHHSLWTRCTDYQERFLHELMAEDRRIFEYWGHAASYLPMQDYRFYIPKMRRATESKAKWNLERQARIQHLIDPIMDRIREEGPLGSRDFEAPTGEEGGTWWDWKPAKIALETLFTRGELMVSERRGFQRRYDLTERVLPPGVDLSVPDDEELGQFLVRRALNAYGIAREREIRDHIRASHGRVIAQAIANMCDSGEIMPVTLTGDDDTRYYATAQILSDIETAGAEGDGVYLLSPFDNLIIQRDRIRRLFQFDYTLECYVPAKKRKYGYFVLPILWGDRLVGRLDPKADRKRGQFIVRNLVFEPDLGEFDRFLPHFIARLNALASFCGCHEIVLEAVAPPEMAPAIRAGLNRI